MKTHCLPIYSLCIAALLTFTSNVVAATQHPELPKIQQINERLYRGAQPRKGGMRRLVEMRINTVINLRGAGAHTRADEAEAKSLGLNYHNIPLPIWGRPKDADISRVLEIINAEESGRVFIHCRDGIDRTGMIVALHRISREGWTTEAATAEALRSGMRGHQYWMRDYIGDFYVRQQQVALSQPAESSNMNDKIGVGVRVGERVVFKTKKTAIRAARRFFGDVF